MGRNARISSRIGRATLILLAATALLIGLVPAGIGLADGDPGYSVERREMRVEDRSSRTYGPSGAWKSMLSFTSPVSYEYRLVRRGAGRTVYGHLSLQVSRYYGGDMLSISYEIDGKRDSILLRPMPGTPAEALLASAMTSEQRWDERDMRLLWTPFAFSRWAGEFSQMQWRSGNGWTIRSGSTEEFRVERVLRDRRENTIFRGRVLRNGKTIMDLDINLALPLPEFVGWVDGAGVRYEAEILWSERLPSGLRM